jgi:hypothetical protein
MNYFYVISTSLREGDADLTHLINDLDETAKKYGSKIEMINFGGLTIDGWIMDRDRPAQSVKSEKSIWDRKEKKTRAAWYNVWTGSLRKGFTTRQLRPIWEEEGLSQASVETARIEAELGGWIERIGRDQNTGWLLFKMVDDFREKFFFQP